MFPVVPEFSFPGTTYLGTTYPDPTYPGTSFLGSIVSDMSYPDSCFPRSVFSDTAYPSPTNPVTRLFRFHFYGYVLSGFKLPGIRIRVF